MFQNPTDHEMGNKNDVYWSSIPDAMFHTWQILKRFLKEKQSLAQVESTWQ